MIVISCTYILHIRKCRYIKYSITFQAEYHFQLDKNFSDCLFENSFLPCVLGSYSFFSSSFGGLEVDHNLQCHHYIHHHHRFLPCLSLVISFQGHSSLQVLSLQFVGLEDLLLHFFVLKWWEIMKFLKKSHKLNTIKLLW